MRRQTSIIKCVARQAKYERKEKAETGDSVL